ncbi:MAG: lipopolysaccharide biosynthesis protein RfbH [Lachnospiraceae bacterium]|jgi:CDP-6-deoxy-D-xylo-4-hexulose-3-dehydrase|nr:lipopolysaccharide biosynthesis protein RfbH [Lachnospiraceae bacterium]
MFENMTEAEAREEILGMVAAYCGRFHADAGLVADRAAGVAGEDRSTDTGAGASRVPAAGKIDTADGAAAGMGIHEAAGVADGAADEANEAAGVADEAATYGQGRDGGGLGRIPYARRVYDADEMTALVDSALDFWLTAGRYTERFEREFGALLGIRYVSLVNSGSSANLLAFMALTSPLLGDRQVLPGDEVITVAAGFPTTVTPVLQYGAVPVFADVTIPQYNIDVAQLERALSPRTKAVMVAHTLGNPFDVGAVKAFCDVHGLWLVEDNCDALGSMVGRRFTGTIGDIGTSSFYPPHHMTMGEGGAVYTDNPLLHKILRSLRDWGRDCVCPSGKDNLCGKRFSGRFGQLPFGYDHKYVYSHFGYNLKATDMQAAIGCAQMKKLPEFIRRRRENFAYLRAALGGAGATDAYILPEALPGSDPSWFGFLLTCREGHDRGRIVRYIEDHGIQTRMLFAGNLTKHPCFDQFRSMAAAVSESDAPGSLGLCAANGQTGQCANGQTGQYVNSQTGQYASGQTGQCVNGQTGQCVAAGLATDAPAQEGRAGGATARSFPRYRIVGDLANTDRIMENSFWVGVYPGLTKDQLAYMAEVIVEAAKA